MPKVSWGRLVHPGLGGPKVNPKGVADGQPVNIPAPLRGRSTDGVTPGVRSAGGRKRPSKRRGWGIGKSIPCIRGVMGRPYGAEGRRACGREKPLGMSPQSPYRNPTQVGWQRMPRGAREPSLRNSANCPHKLARRGAPRRGRRLRPPVPRGPQRAGRGDCLLKTQAPANAKADV